MMQALHTSVTYALCGPGTRIGSGQASIEVATRSDISRRGNSAALRLAKIRLVRMLSSPFFFFFFFFFFSLSLSLTHTHTHTHCLRLREQLEAGGWAAQGIGLPQERSHAVGLAAVA